AARLGRREQGRARRPVRGPDPPRRRVPRRRHRPRGPRAPMTATDRHPPRLTRRPDKEDLMLPIAKSELVQVLRDRAVLITSLLMPLAASAFFIGCREVFAGIGRRGYVAAGLVFSAAACSLYVATVTTLAGRRQSLFLRRLRSTAAGDAAILTGLVLPVTV